MMVLNGGGDRPRHNEQVLLQEESGQAVGGLGGRRVELVEDPLENDLGVDHEEMLVQGAEAEVLKQSVGNASIVLVAGLPWGDNLVVLGGNVRVDDASTNITAGIQLLDKVRGVDHLVERGSNGVKEGLAGGKDLESLGVGDNVAQSGAVVDGRDADVSVDLASTISVLHPVSGENTTLGMTDNVDLGSVGLGQHIVDKGTQFRGRILNGSKTTESRDLLVLAVGQAINAVALLDEHGNEITPRINREKSRVDQDERTGMGGAGLAVVVVDAINVALLKVAVRGNMLDGQSSSLNGRKGQESRTEDRGNGELHGWSLEVLIRKGSG